MQKSKKGTARAVPKVNYGKFLTEQSNPRTRSIDRLPVEKILELITSEDQRVPQAVAKAKKEIAAGVRIIVESLQKGGRLFFAGAGTSGRLGFIEAAECPPTFSTSPALVQAVMAGGRKAVFRSKEGAEDDAAQALRIFQKKLRSGDVMVGITASGVTPFVRGVFQAAKRRGAKTILVTCGNTMPDKKLTDCVIAVKPGPEVISGSTRLKAGTATKLVLNMLTVTSMIQLGKVYKNWMVDLQPKSKKLEARALRLISHLGSVPEASTRDFLLKARKNVKVAILMAKKKWDYPTALKTLKKNSGFLEKALHADFK